MAPAGIASTTPVVTEIRTKTVDAPQSTYIREPLKYTGSLDEYRHFDTTPFIEPKFPDLQLTDILSDDKKIQDLAIFVSQQGVVFFRSQSINSDEQKVLGQKLGELTGKPSTSKRGIAVNENGKLDDEISVISSEVYRNLDGDWYMPNNDRLASGGWHADIAFECVPSDYAFLKITDVPEDRTDDDTL